MVRTRIKICCIQSIVEARLAIAHGADALGLVGAMPSGFGPIEDSLISAITQGVPPPVATFLLTSETTVDGIVAHARRCRPSVLQLVERIAPGDCRRVRAALPGIGLVQVIHVTGPESVAAAQEAGSAVDALLLDTGHFGGAVRQLGGTGVTHDWRVSRRIVETAPCPVFLAGGLKVDNVAKAIAEVSPFAVDVCTGVRTEGRLDAAKLGAFVAAVQGCAQSRTYPSGVAPD